MKRMVATGGLALVLALGGGWLLTQGASTSPATAQLPGAALAQEAAASEASEIEVTEMALGTEDAPVEVIEYASYTCPHCANFHDQVFPQLKSEYIDTGKVRFVYREVYFDKYGMWASLVARCGGEQKFFGITDMIYDGQRDWVRAGSDGAIADELRKNGRLAGLGDDQIEACLTDGDQLRALVGWYQENAEADGIQSTPSFVIDGETYTNMSYAEFSELLDEKVEAAE